jgi:transposase InsO family protein
MAGSDPDERPEGQDYRARSSDEAISRYGVPSVLHSDQSPNFERKILKEMCRLLGTTKMRTTPYHPQSDGLVERLYRTIIDMLA